MGSKARASQRGHRVCLASAVEISSERVVGGTRFLHIVPEHRRLEIGSTWIAKQWRRTAINTEAKFLMLEHAFEKHVEFMADALNEPSRMAILRIGATEEGTFRDYIITAAGEIHDAVFYSFYSNIESEWPPAKVRLQEMMALPYRREIAMQWGAAHRCFYHRHDYMRRS
ncbi:MAG: GNAT family N-acetyltransferase [Chloracidobacterium sp.]|nr:GNAT family N-acetyltransferase [Chloracidobacterium sp.]